MCRLQTADCVRTRRGWNEYYYVCRLSLCTHASVSECELGGNLKAFNFFFSVLWHLGFTFGSGEESGWVYTFLVCMVWYGMNDTEGVLCQV